MANILYRKQKQQKSLDNGTTWVDTGGYRVGDVLENPSNCASSDSKQCRWVELDASEGYYCDETTYTKYTVQVEECSENGLIWTRTGNQQQGNTVIQTYSTDCGFVYTTNYGNIKYLTNNQNSRIYFNGYYSTYMNMTDYGNGVYLASESVDGLLLEYDKKVFDSTSKLFLGTNGFTNYSNPIEIIELPDTSDVIDMSYMFYDCSGLTSLDLSSFVSFNTSNVTDMSYMFSNCSGLTSLDVSNFNTSNVTDMSNMFSYCSSLPSLNVSSFNTSNVTDMEGMFSGCYDLTSLDLSNFNTSNVGVDDNDDGSRDFAFMLSNCSSLTSLNVSSFDTSNSRDMGYMFQKCSGLTSLDVSNFDTSNVTDMTGMFNGCSSLTTLDLSNFNTSNVTEMDSLFYGCSSLTSLDLSGWDFSNVTNYNYMLYGCNNLRNVNLSNCIFKDNIMNNLFNGFEYLNNVNFSNVDTSNVTYMGYMFNDCYNLTTLDLSSFDTSNVISMEGMFRDCESLTSINVSGWNIDNMLSTKLYYMFENCTSLEELILGDVEQYEYDWWCTQLTKENISCDIIVSNIKSQGEISFTFEASGLGNGRTFIFKLNNTQYTAKTTNSDSNEDGTYTYTATLGDLDIETLTSCNETFSYDSSYGYATLKNLISFPNTSNVTSMNYMFKDCSSLTTLDLSSFNTSKVTTMWYMFWNCTSLQTINLSNWNTSNVTDMTSMFYQCSGLTSLDLSGWDMSNVTDNNYSYMFYNCNNLATIYCYNCNQTTINVLNSIKPKNCTLVY